MGPIEHFSVQLFMDDGSVDKSKTVTIEAMSPLAAAEAALGEPLALEGSTPRALVWRLTAGFVPYSVTLYEPSASRDK